jgi:muramidase (phage lysozyme)
MADTIDSDIAFLTGYKAPAKTISDEDLKHPNVQAYLQYLNAYEGKPKENQSVGYRNFTDLSDHPRKKYAFNDKGDVSDAAGAYQLLGDTWAEQKKKLGLKDFSLPNQQKAAVGLLSDIGALEHIKSGDFTKANELAKNRWASLPGSTIGFKTGQIPKYNKDAEAILTQASSDYDPDVQFITGYTPRPGLSEEDLSKPYFGNPNLARQGEKSREETKSGLIPLVEDIAKPLSDITLADWKKRSTPALAAKLQYGTDKEKQEAIDEIYKGSEKFVQGVQSFYNNPNKLQTIANAFKNVYEHPGEAIGEAVKSTIYRPEQIAIGNATGNLLSDVAKGGTKAVKNIVQDVAQSPAGQQLAQTGSNILQKGKQAVGEMQDVMQATKQAGAPPAIAPEVSAPNVGAAQVNKQNAVNALIPNLASDTANLIKSVPPERVNLPALETKAMEDTHGIKLSQGQRTGDNSKYANEWNARDTNPQVQKLFSEQPQQFVDAFEKIKDKHASDIGELTKENIGQMEINALAAKDKMRTDAINAAKQALVDENGGQFPVDIGALKENINNALGSNYKSRYLSDALKGDLEDFYKNPTFEAYEHMRSNLADEMRSAKDGKSRQAAYIARDELEKLPIFGEEGGSPQAMKLKALADTYRKLNVERYNIIKTNPAYKAAIKEAADAADAGAMESLNAANFHDKFVTGKSATPEVVRRMVLELQDNPEAMKAIRAGDILNAENALVPNKMTPQLRPDAYNKYLRSQADKAKFIHSPESAQDLLDIGILSSKVAKPAENVFNYSNSYSAYLGDLLKHGVQLKGEGVLAAATKGASIPIVAGGKELFKHYSSRKFANETTHPHSGLVNKE